MDGFNSREFYGHSLSEDPKLRTTTRNYEFKYNSSDHLERIINRVRMDREKKNEIEILTPNNGHDVKFHNRFPKTDKSQVMKMPHLETQIGRSRSRKAVVKIMSDEEIEAMLSQALHSTNTLPASKEIKTFKDDFPSIEINKPEEILISDEKLPRSSVEILPNLRPQWVEIKPVEKSVASLFEVPVDSIYDEDSSDSEDLSALNLSDEPPEKENERLVNETIRKNFNFDSISLGSIMTDDFVIRNQESDFQNNDNNAEEDSPPESHISLDIESSLNETEHLEMERVFEKVLPHVPEIQFQSLDIQEKNEYSEYSDGEDGKEVTINQEDDSFGEEEFDIQTDVKFPKIDTAPQPIQTLSFRSARSSPTKTARSKSVKKNSKLIKVAINLTSNRSPPIHPSLDVRSSIPIEDLKQEKLRIFSKMTSIQEKIIKSLDALRISLVEISLPDGEIEQKLRERNALEFSVRFSRNYLFPLGKMLDDLRLSPNEDYRSALTNEPCVKVCGIYGLLCQAIQCYQKQLRHFCTDSFPKKLDILLNLVKDTTTICLQKKIFDSRDTLIQSLISRCEMFLTFVVEFAEKKKKSARSEEIALQSERRSRFKLPKTSSKWDLTMNLNNLNMYEPKLVLKKTKKSSQKKIVLTDRQRHTSKTKKTKLIPRDSAHHVALPNDDPVETQVRKDNNVDSVQLINDAIAEEPDSELAKAVIETLQDITKDEVHQMFGPIVLNLDSILKSSDNPQIAVESVLNVLKSKFQEANGKQLKIDEITTENSTQNINSYQKEVTKKGTHSSKGKQQKQQFKETRQNNVSKANVASCSSKNVKEDSTEQTERYSRNELTDTNTICDKQSQSLRNIDDVVTAFVSEIGSMEQKTRSGAFLSATAAKAKKPTPAPDANEVDGGIAAPPPSTPLSIIKLDDVMPPPPPSRGLMTSEQCLDYSSAALPLGLLRTQADRYFSESQKELIGDGKHRKEDAASHQRNVRDGAANAFYRAKGNQGAWRNNLPVSSSTVRNEPTKSGEMDKLYYRSNALYTFVKYLENSSISQNEEVLTENLNENPNDSNEIKPQDEDTSVKPAEEDNFESPIGTKLMIASSSFEKLTNEEHNNDIDIKALLEERNNFIERCRNDPFYANPQFPQPWKVLSKISKVIAREIVENFEDDLSFGEESYIRDFIDMEMQN